ncbi:hypothetical protein [Actinomycetospora cinnamomea]|uniref:Uncharacterized protein n=1 Tax=Actinomycetospora cinnamomea TaxID=663609 RepID=A0A2U1F438_9PSEU|nr:hypothetical protein [Actinomycetospora cinnamomea]PVZ06928.1 hypothetical protein C8D89_112121 [Actinomycetospora cinnamomea]
MDEDVSSGDGGPAASPLRARPDLPVSRPFPRPSERSRYQPLRGLEELLDDVLGAPAPPR